MKASRKIGLFYYQLISLLISFETCSFIFRFYLLFLYYKFNTMKKRRSDRNHLVYRVINKITGEFYIGITVLRGRAYKSSLKLRLKQHISRALNEDKSWRLCNSIRSFGPDKFIIELLEVVRGKAEAHIKEINIIKELKPQLNTASCQ